MTYLAVVQGEGWSLTRDDLVREIRERWPDATVQTADVLSETDPARDVVWHTGTGSERVDGSSHVSGQCIYVDGQNDAVAPVVAWYRQLVPADQEVIFCDDTYSFDLQLEPNVTPASISEYLEQL
jgi:hypothetical protein